MYIYVCMFCWFFVHHLPVLFVTSGCSAPSGICVQIYQVLEEVDGPVNGEEFHEQLVSLIFSSRAFLVVELFVEKELKSLEIHPLKNQTWVRQTRRFSVKELRSIKWYKM